VKTNETAAVNLNQNILLLMGRNPTPVDVVDIPIFIGFYTSQVVGLGISEPSTVTQQEQLNPVTPPTSTMVFSRPSETQSCYETLGCTWQKGHGDPDGFCWVSPDFFL